ncbi:hypothetical protein [Mucisphaera calidilacus]|uniref:Uncharacterized protein n=1 Tax=Mucisphaera calidilacus TaxID=2527982 RepID=A0A518BTX1_9BACT|nr:hypothetical protein [Mucisphaera calidilacus]QDU70426.1 hypothetical protein Pan265_02530 [Mucisphaera calidilacus]
MDGPGFVILEHRLPGAPHFDLMLSLGACRDPEARDLWTVRVGERPGGWAGRVVVADRLADHRRAYLRRTGLVSGGRGTVRRVDRGRLWVHRLAEGLVDVSVCGRVVAGRLRGERLAGDRWRLSFRV